MPAGDELGAGPGRRGLSVRNANTDTAARLTIATTRSLALKENLGNHLRKASIPASSSTAAMRCGRKESRTCSHTPGLPKGPRTANACPGGVAAHQKLRASIVTTSSPQ